MAANEKKPAGFFLYPEHVRAACAMLRPADAGRLLLALCDYAETGALPSIPRKAFQACFALLRADIDRDADRYREICERNRERINRRWHSAPPAESDADCHGVPRYTTVYRSIPTQPNPAQHNPAQHNPAQHNPAQHNPPPAGAAAAARSPYPHPNTKGVSHDRTGNPCKPASARGTVL